MSDTTVTIKNIDIKHETNAAVQICTEEGELIWIPFSQVEKLVRSPHAGQSQIVLESWIAKKKGLL